MQVFVLTGNIESRYFDFASVFQKLLGDVAADESGAPDDTYCFHSLMRVVRISVHHNMHRTVREACQLSNKSQYLSYMRDKNSRTYFTYACHISTRYLIISTL